MTSNVKHLFMWLYVICIYSFINCLFKYFVHFLIGLFISLCKYSFCVLGLSALRDICIKNILLQSVTQAFYYVRVTFRELNFLIIIKCRLSFFLYHSCFLYSKKSLPALKLQRFSPMFVSRIFRIDNFTFRCVTHFTLIMYDVRLMFFFSNDAQ